MVALSATAAAITGGVAAVGGGLAANNSRNNAVKDAARAQSESTDAAIQLQRDIYEDNTARSEPFRQLELQQANAYGEIFGFDPVGDEQSSIGAVGGLTRPGMTDYAPPAGRSNASFEDFVRVGGGGAGVEPYMQSGPFAGYANPAPQPQEPASQFTGSNGQALTGQDAARARFEGSMFNDVYRDTHARDVDRIDAGLSSQGLAFSGARTQAVEDARADRFGQTFSNYLSSLMGSPPQQATNTQNQAGTSFANNTGQLLINQGNNEAQSAYIKGENQAGIFDGITQLGGFALGGGFG